ncbi:MAG: NAD(+) synthase [Massiliimalia sp.]|jgi:NAD+ synthase (glutamine-hydrolysing)
MNSFLRVACVSNQITLGNPLATAESINALIDGIKGYDPHIYLFPSCALTGSNLGNLAYHRNVIAQCQAGVESILKQTRKLNAYIVLGSLLLKNGKPQPVTYVLQKGVIRAVLESEEDYRVIFGAGDISFNVCAVPSDNMLLASQDLAYEGADVTLIPGTEPAIAGNSETYLETIRTLSKTAACGVAACVGSVGDTSFPYVSRGITALAECGTVLAMKQSLMGSIFTVADFDMDIIRSHKAQADLPLAEGEFCDYMDAQPHEDLLRQVSQDPYLPQDPKQKTNYLLDLFQLQSASLSARLQHIHCDKVVIGVSGGLDSTLALLVCANAFTALNLPKKNITAVTMQGFGTSGSTYENALTLMNALGCTVREVPIRDSVLQHFADIGQDPNCHDVTYENAQARERTQILLDIANQQGAIVVGTGDLSEEALGFATFAGDHIANFNVNTCVTKTMIRALVQVLSQTTRFKNCQQVLQAILDTPISPELLPPDENGAISQKTEEILGPYLLHDFFLYYFLKYHFTPKKIFLYAKKAFGDQYDSAYLKEKLAIFLKRFCQSQFKRSCTPDSAAITEVNLSNSHFFMPSDLDASLFLKELDQLD